MKSYRRKDNENTRRFRRIARIEIDAKEGKLHTINEMAITLKKFLEKVEGIQYELIRNWCLCKWCQIYDPSNSVFSHWKDELCTFMNQLNLPVIKNKIDKRKHLQHILIDESEFNDANIVLKTIRGKFEKEHINDISQRICVASECAKNINYIIDALVDNDRSIESYVENEFESDDYAQLKTEHLSCAF